MSGHHGDVTREGEVAAELPPATDAGLRFVGRIHTPFATRADCPHAGDREEGPECVVEVFDDYAPALERIEERAHLQLLYWLHEARRDLLTQRRKGDGPVMGTFALRSPLRPNPIGVSVVRLIRREGNRLVVRGLDCLDGTPLVDVKPITCAE